jgi:CheY-like chemotaxis protein/Tfp pilus assembly protein PilZ
MNQILLVDDVKLLLEFQKKFLASSSVHILTACDGIEALEVAHRERPDLIVMDKYMPKMDGIACCSTLKSDPMLKHIPVIMVSNAARPADIEEYTRIGCSDYLAKPIDGKLFLNTIKKYLPAIERRGARVICRAAVQLTRNGAVHPVMSEDISMGGIYLVTDLPIISGEELQLSFVLPRSQVPTEVRGKVTWVNRNSVSGGKGSLPGVGVEFIEITGSGIPLLRRSELTTYVSSSSS